MKNTLLTISYIFLTTSLLFAQSITKSNKLTEESVVALNETALSDRLPVCLPPGCRCEGGITEIQLYYLGTSNVNIEVFRNQIYTDLIATTPNVTTGDLITVSAATLPSGQFAYYTYFRVTDLTTGEACTNRIYTQCPRNAWPGALSDLQILGKRFGDLFVYGYTSSAENQQCDIGDIEQYWKVGGNIVAPDNMTFGTLNNEAVSIITNNLERGIITNEGDFGFGTNAPALKLDVSVTAGDSPNNGNGIRVTTNTSDAGLRLENTNGGQNYYIHSTGTGSSNRTGNLAFGRLGQIADMVLTSTGNVGIGTTLTHPDARLHVIGERVRFSDGISHSLDFLFGGSNGIDINAQGDNLNIHTPNNRDILINTGATDGDIGIGLTSLTPQTKLHVEGDGIRLSTAGNMNRYLDMRTDETGLSINSVNDDFFIRSGSNDIFINSQAGDGKVGIGTTNLPNTVGGADISTYKLYVQGGILTEELRVRTGWSDYVFRPDYRLLSLEKVEEHIQDYGHLHNTPSEEEVVANGLSVGDAAVNQQEKIEEIFLHLIEMNKKLKALEEENSALKQKLEKLVEDKNN